MSEPVVEPLLQIRGLSKHFQAKVPWPKGEGVPGARSGQSTGWIWP